MLKFINQNAQLYIYKDGDRIFGELSIEGKIINREEDGFSINLYDYENQKLDVVINGKELSYKGQVIKTYKSVFKHGTILDLLVKDGRGKVVLNDIVLEEIKCDLARPSYKVNVSDDEHYVIARYANLHQHTENSLLDGMVRIPELAEKIEYCSAITDHGNMFGWYDMLHEFEKRGKKAIIGEEFYIETLGGPRLVFPKDLKKSETEELMFDNAKTQNEDGLNGEHLIILAKNNTGLKNLFYLSSEAANHFYRKPHITFEELKNHKEGLIVLSACIASGVNQFIKEYLRAISESSEVRNLIENYGEAFYEDEFAMANRKLGEAASIYAYNHRYSRKWIDFFVKEFGDDFYFEYQDHHFPLETTIMKELVRIRDEEYPSVKICATTDAHYLNEDDAYVHELFLCKQTKKTIDDPKHMKFSGDGYFVHSSEEMLKFFPEEYLDTTLEIADKIAYEPLGTGYHLPVFPLPDGFKTDSEYFKYLCNKGFKEKFPADIVKNPVYRERLKSEGQVIESMGWPSYFLIVQDFIRWAEDTNVKDHWKDYFPDKELDEIPEKFLKDYPIYVGSGRGSGAGSLINYCLGITKVNPLEYDLDFARFLNPDRISMPDIDTDFEDAARGKVLDYVRFKYGKKKVANIITFGTAAAKNSIKTINSVLGYPVKFGDSITSMIPERPGVKIKDALEDKDFKDLYNSNDDARRIIDYAMRIEGLKTSQSIHPCGVLITDKDIINYMPETQLEDPDTGEKVWVTQMEGPTCEELGCLKMDFLGLRTLGYVHECLNSIKKNTGKEIDYEKIPLTDLEVYRHLARGNTASMFQIESDMFTTVIRKTLKDVLDEDSKATGEECFNRLVAMNALVRPGSNVFIDDFANYIIHPEEAKYLVPELKPILEETYGIILYQEQTMRITRDLAGFSAGQADTVRKAMGKKKKYIMDEYKDYFVHGNKKMNIEGCVNRGIPEDKATELWDIMALASSYSFNKSHAVAYSVHSIRTAWLSYHYPYEYMTSVLNSYADDTEKLGQYMNVAREQGLTLLSPSINGSEENFTTDGKGIQIGVSGIKGINAVAANIIEERKNGGRFASLVEFLRRMSYYDKFNRKTIESLVYSGMLDEYCGSRLNKINQLDEMANYVKNLKSYRTKLVDGKKHKNLTEPVLNMEESDVEMDKYALLKQEKVFVGMYLSGNPMDLFAPYIGKCPDCSNVSSGNTAVCGIVSDVARKVSKKGNTFYTFKLENNGVISGILFSKNGETISNNDAVRIEGEVRINEYGTNITVRVKEDLTFLREVCENLEDVYIKLSTPQEAIAFQKIKFANGTRKIIAVYNDKPKEFANVSIDPRTAEEIISLVGVDNITVGKSGE